jgi:hypothetical protein
MIRDRHEEIVTTQYRHRVLCDIIGAVPEGQYLVERARHLGIPVDWNDQRVYPSRPGNSDFGCVKKLAEEVARTEQLRRSRQYGTAPDYLLVDALSRKQGTEEATQIFNHLRADGIHLSGYQDGRYFTCAAPMPWSPGVKKHRAPALELVPPRSTRH